MDKIDLQKQIEEIRRLHDLNMIQEASIMASELALSFPRAADIQFMAGKSLFDIGDLETAAFHLELASANLSVDENGIISFDELSSIMGLLARCGNVVAAQSVWLRNTAKIDYPSLTFDQLKQISDVLIVLEMLDEATALLSECVNNFDNNDEFVEFMLIMAKIFHANDDVSSEFETFEIALKTDPLNARLHNKLANFLSRLRAYDLASDHIKFIQKINPDYKYKSIAQDFFAVSKSGSFEQQEKIKNYWLANPDEPQDSKAPFATLLLTDDPKFLYEDCLQFADWTQLIKGKPRRSESPLRPTLPSDRKIRVGYVSPDFRNHAVCHLVTDLIQHHNRQKFEVFGYGISFMDNSTFREKIIGNFDHFRSLEDASTHDVVKQIETDKLDICVDLCGYTTGMLGTLFNRINGPLLVNYLGFPGTLAHPQYDYIIGDTIVTPPETDDFFSEKVIRLDCCYQTNSPSRTVDPVTIEETGLPKDSFVFCNFNTRQKLNRETLKAWSGIVSDCKDSVLWLLDPGESMKQELLTELDSICERVFFAPMKDIPEHLGRVRHANLFLDSFPYGAHTTASDAVFSGIPVLARTGRSFQSRVSWSIIHHAGLEDFHADSWDLFHEKAKSFYDRYTDERRDQLNEFLTDYSRPKHPYNIQWTTLQIEQAYEKMLSN
jgi:predicted O-linked N-acetylglucosamine transferase (SPINDLY family)